MAKLVIDTNALLQIIPNISIYHDLWISLFDGRNQFCVSNDILEEYEEVLALKLNPLISKFIIEQIINNPFTSFITPYFNFNLIFTDPDDNKFVDCSIIAGAKFIVTEDKHFNILKKIDFPKVDIISLDEIIKII